MQKHILLLLSLILSLSLSAQIDQGTILLSGSTDLSFGSLKLDEESPLDPGTSMNDEKEARFNTNLLIGYFFGNGFAAGIQGSYVRKKEEILNNGVGHENIENTILVSPTIRYYIGETGVWTQASYGIGNVNVEHIEKNNNWKNKDKLSQITFGIGYAIYLSRDIALNPYLTYNMITRTEMGNYKTAHGYPVPSGGSFKDLERKWSGIDFSLGLSIHLD